MSSDGGNTWGLRCQLPGQAYGSWGDLSVRFSAAGNWLLFSYLSVNSTLEFHLRGTTTMFLPYFAGNLLPPGFGSTSEFDQPRLGARPWSAEFAVAVSDQGFSTGCSWGMFLWAKAVSFPPSLAKACVAHRPATERPRAQQVAIHRTGVAYVAFLEITGEDGPDLIGNVVLVRGTPSTLASLSDLVEPPGPGGCDHPDGAVGVRVRRCLRLPWGPAGSADFGWEVRRGALAIAVHPEIRQRVYLAYGDVKSNSSSLQTLHLLRSDDGGMHWSSLGLAKGNATNPGLAVDGQGRLGFLYQRFANGRWTHQLDVWSDANQLLKEIPLANTGVPKAAPPGGPPFQGDYLDLLATGNEFLGVFSAWNDPQTAVFPFGVKYQRLCENAGLRSLWLPKLGSQVNPSVDPFFFRVEMDQSSNPALWEARMAC
ncbi:MAG: hypothetical protein ACKVZ0_17380 [Gemmatimonadales bacterium]